MTAERIIGVASEHLSVSVLFSLKTGQTPEPRYLIDSEKAVPKRLRAEDPRLE